MVVNKGICAAPPRQSVGPRPPFEAIGNMITDKCVVALTAHCIFQRDALGNGNVTFQRPYIRKGLGIEVDFLMV